eukprot:2171219-Pleurochrysis_carterae.AAC.1
MQLRWQSALRREGGRRVRQLSSRSVPSRVWRATLHRGRRVRLRADAAGAVAAHRFAHQLAKHRLLLDVPRVPSDAAGNSTCKGAGAVAPEAAGSAGSDGGGKAAGFDAESVCAALSPPPSLAGAHERSSSDGWLRRLPREDTLRADSFRKVKRPPRM